MTEPAYRLVPWTLAALLMSALPHVTRTPIQISAIVICILLWRVFLHRKVKRMPPQWLKITLALAAFAVVLLTFRTINGVDAGGALLLCMVAIKTLEMNTLRDHAVLVLASFFIIASFILYSTNIWSAIYLIIATAFSVFALLKISAPNIAWRELLPNAKPLLWYGLPLAVILFVLFPRIPGPLWGIPNFSSQAKAGLSDSMTPGSITKLVTSEELAFRAKFLDTEPARKYLYWRGPVLHNFDGSKWSMRRMNGQRSSESNADFQNVGYTKYEVILEPHNKRWLFVLDYPQMLPEQSWMLPDFQVGRIRPISQLTRYTASALIQDNNPTKSRPFILKRALQLPDNTAEKTRALAQQWRNEYKSDSDIVNAALTKFNQDKFSYTLEPQALDMTNSVDDFLFRTQEGFCEHYASAFVVLMRAANIPARVVTGYLGGEKNTFNDYYRIKQSDAHAWAEVYLPERGWVRVDPTAAIAPERIEKRLQDVLTDANLGGMFSGKRFFLRAENAWYALNTLWFEYVLDFNAEKQMNLLDKLGFKNPNWSSLIWLLVSGIIAITLLMSYLIWQQSRNIVRDPIQRVYLQFKKRLEKLDFIEKPGEGPKDLGQRAMTALPDQQETIKEFITNYINIRYQQKNQKNSSKRKRAAHSLKQLLKQL